MTQVAMTINGRLYRLTCEESERDRLMQLGAEVARRVENFTTSFGQVGENRLLFLAAMRLADELMEARALLEEHTGFSLEDFKDVKNAQKTRNGGKSSDKKSRSKAERAEAASSTEPKSEPQHDDRAEPAAEPAS